MTMTMTKTEFVKQLNNSEMEDFFTAHFTLSERISLFREIIVGECDYCEADIYPFDEDEIKMLFPNPYDAMRAAHFGDVDWNDEWLIVNAYGNLESVSNATEYMCQYIDEMADGLRERYENEICEYFGFDEEEWNKEEEL